MELKDKVKIGKLEMQKDRLRINLKEIEVRKMEAQLELEGHEEKIIKINEELSKIDQQIEIVKNSEVE